MKKLCSKIFEISNKTVDGYFMLEDKHKYVWTDEMIEGLVGEESLTPPLKHPEDSALAMLFHKTLILPEGYQFVDENGNVINATKIVLEKKKKEYPKTYEECAEIIAELTGSDCNPKGCMGYMSVQLTALQKLLMCRDAYWKIAGEEMGLGKPWEPDWRKEGYIIYRNQDDIISGYRPAGFTEHHIFEFPIKEMRDAFKENFNPVVEICKELL